MKKLLAAVCVALAGMSCGPSIDLAERPLFSNGVNTITFLVYDAFTGAPIQDATINVQIGPHTIAATQTEGTNAYVASQLPPGTHLATVEAPGHLGFLGRPTAPSSGTLSNPASQVYTTYQVALYPETSVTQNVTVRAFDSTTGAPITNGTLVAQLTGNSSIGPSFDNELPGTLTVRPSVITVAFDAQGTAIIPAASLVLGGVYSVDVFNATSGSNYLQPAENVTFEAGRDLNNITLFMGPPAEDPVAVTVNNEDVGGVDASLIITFPYPVDVCSDPDDHYWWIVVGSNLDADANFLTPRTPDPVRVTQSPDSTVLTLFPEKAVEVDPDDGRHVIRFEGVSVRVRNASNCVPLSSVDLRNGGNIDRSIVLQDS